MSLLKFENNELSFYDYVYDILWERGIKVKNAIFADRLFRCIENGYFSERKIEEKFSRYYDEEFAHFRENISIPICDSKWRIDEFTYSPELAKKIITTCISHLNNTGYFKVFKRRVYSCNNNLCVHLSFTSEDDQTCEGPYNYVGLSGLLNEFDHNAFNTLYEAANCEPVVVTRFEQANCLLLNKTNNNISIVDMHEIPKLIKDYEIQNVIDTVKSYFPSHFAKDHILMPKGF